VALVFEEFDISFLSSLARMNAISNRRKQALGTHTQRRGDIIASKGWGFEEPILDEREIIPSLLS